MAEESTIPQGPNCHARTNTERSEQQTPGGQRRRERMNSPLQGYKMEEIQEVVELTKSVRRQNSGRGPTQKKSKMLAFYYRRSTTMTKEPEEDENVPEGSSGSS